MNGTKDNKKEIHYWQIAPGRKAELWSECLKDGNIRIGWDELPDLSNIGSKEELRKEYNKIKGKEKPTDIAMLWYFIHDIQPGDIIITNNGKQSIQGIGKVIGNYKYSNQYDRYKHLIEINWFDTKIRDISNSKIKDKFGKTIVPLTENELKQIQDLKPVINNYWIFQGNPDYFRLRDYIKDNKVITWGVKQYKKEMEIADMVYIWESKEQGGIIAKGQIISQPKKRSIDDEDSQYYKKDVDKAKFIVDLHILDKKFISKENILKWLPSLPIFKNNRGTNFKISKEEGETIENLFYNDLYKLYKKLSDSLNVILYGPPGTGKTYQVNQLKNYWKEKFGEDSVEFVTFHQSYAYEEFVEGIKPVLFESKENAGEPTSDLQYKIEAGIFKKACVDALWDYLGLGNKPEVGEFQTLVDKFKDKFEVGAIIKTKAKGAEFTIKSYTERSIQITVNENQYSISYEPLEKLYYSDKEEHLTKASDVSKRLNGYAGLGSYYYAILKELNKIEVTDQEIEKRSKTFSYEEKERKIAEIVKGKTKYKFDLNCKNYLIVIDEINRGNISKIFGELITLIEKDKRAGNEQKIPVKLPYSGESFVVPPNLYIIGTMNTADRSIALIDTALRRRFSFVEMMPDENLIPNIEIKGINIRKMFKKINERIEFLYDRDHTIGHSYFMKVTNYGELCDVMADKIIPLLQEYFYENWEKIQYVLGEHLNEEEPSEFEADKNAIRFIQSKLVKPENILGDNNNDDYEDKLMFRINPLLEEGTIDAEAFIKIYSKKSNDNENEKA